MTGKDGSDAITTSPTASGSRKPGVACPPLRRGGSGPLHTLAFASCPRPSVAGGHRVGLLRGRFFGDLTSSEGAPGSGVRDGFARGSSGIFASRGKEFPDFHALWHIV